MKQPVRLDFDVTWTINPNKLMSDPMGRQLKNIGEVLPYRVYLQPINELLSDKSFSAFEQYYVSETHFLELDSGAWSLTIEDVTGWLNLEISNVKLNTVSIETPSFTLG